MFKKRLGCKWSGFWMLSEIRTNCHHFEWSGFLMVGIKAIAVAKARLFGIWPSKSPVFKWLDFKSSLKSIYYSRHILQTYFKVPMLYILTSVLVLRTPKADRNLLLQCFLHIIARFWCQIDKKWGKKSINFAYSKTLVDKKMLV